MRNYRACSINFWRGVVCHVTFSSVSQLEMIIVQMREKEEKGEKKTKFNFQPQLMYFNWQNK